MRNLKRALSLTLASVMLLGMMVVGSSAAKGYDDVADTDNVEAIEVLQAIEVMVGDDRGFGPERPVNRAEMAVVMGKLLSLDYNYYSTSCPFNDVYDWAQGWVGACAANGIVSGRGDGIYDPGATVTAVEAASMLMRALGYFKYTNDYADGFEVSTVRQGTIIGIFDNVGSSATEPMTRNQVAQMVLNALQSAVVEPDGNTINLTTPDGTVLTGKVNYVSVTSNKPFARAISSVQATSIGSTNDSTIVELGERLYNGDLKLYGNDMDAFNRPARTWEYKGEEVGTYVKKELLREDYSVKVTGKTLYDLLTKNTIDDYSFVISVDGVERKDANAKTLLGSAWFDQTSMVRTNDDAVGATGKGVTTEVYVDTQNKIVYIAVINTYLAIASDDYDEKDDELDLTVYNIEDKNNNTRSPIYVKAADDEPMTVSGEDFAITEVKENDKFLVNVAQGEIQTMKAPEVLSEVIIDAFKLDDYVTTGSSQYDHASTARYDVDVLDNYDVSNLKEITYNIILDQYGYLIGLERNEDPDQYVFLTGIDSGASNLYATRADANVIHMDGTMETVKVDLTKSRNNLSGTQRLLVGNTKNLSQLNTWCKYTVSDDGVYTLKMIPTATNADVRPATNPKVAQFAQNVDIYDDSANGGSTNVKEINEKRVSLIGWDETNFGTLDTGERYVYGNDDTVYINVTLESVVVDDGTNGGKSRRIVDDVDTVIVGVKNVNLEMTALPTNYTDGYRNPDYEIYTLYNDKGIVIAAVTIGEDNGTSTNYAYITGNVDREEYGHKGTSTKVTEGKWTWYRNAVVDGKKTRLTETADTMDVLDTLIVGEWYEIKYTANGDVRKAKHVGTDLPFGDVSGTYVSGKYVSYAKNVETAVNSVSGSTVLLSDITTVDQLRFENGTLYTQINDTKGFHVGTDVKVVVVNANKAGTKEFDSVTDGFTGYNGVEKAIRAMNCRGTAPSAVRSDGTEWIELSAIMTNGFASVIVINDKSPESAGQSGTGTLVAADGLTTTVDFASMTVTTQIAASNGTGVIRSNFRAALAEQGLTVTSMELISGSAGDPTEYWEIVTSDGQVFDGVANRYYSVKVDNTIVEWVYADNATAATKNVATGDWNGTHYRFIGTVDSNPAMDVYGAYTLYANALAVGQIVKSNIVIESGFVAVASASGGSGTVTTAPAGGYVKYNGDVTVSAVYAANSPAASNYNITLTVTYADATTETITKTIDATKANNVEFKVEDVKKEISTLAITEAAAVAPHELSVQIKDGTGAVVITANGLTVTAFAKKDGGVAGDKILVDVTIVGQETSADAGNGGTKMTLSGATASWSSSVLPANATAAGTVLTIAEDTNYTTAVDAQFEVTLSGTSNETVVITIEDVT